MNYDYDILFLGGGLNYAGAIIASKGGLKTALVEKNMEHLGGTCLHNGCIPSKMYLHAVETIRTSKHSHFEGTIHLNIEKLHEEKEQLLSNASRGIKKQCQEVELIDAKGVLVKPHTVKIGEAYVSAKYIVIGTGAEPFIPEGIMYDGEWIITSDEVLNLRALPHKIAIYGDGAIGLEMACFFASAGVETELIWRHTDLLRNAHPMISTNMKAQLETLGIRLKGKHSIATAKHTPERGVHIVFEDKSEHYVEKLLVATGRHAVVDAIETEAIEIGSKGIKTDAHFETTLAHHYAVGDCNGKIQLAHAARAEVLYVVRKLLGKNPETIHLEQMVKFIHTLPLSYAQVGKSKSALEKEGKAYRESVIPLKGLPFAYTHDASLGVIVVYADEDDFIVGGELLLPNAEELISVVAMAIAGEMDSALAKRTILAHPTFSESLEKSFLRL